MRRREFFKVVASGFAGAAGLAVAQSESPSRETCLWVRDGCAPSNRYQYYTDCHNDFLTLDKSRAENHFYFCIYCSGRIFEMKQPEGGADNCGRWLLDG